jgi:polyferredoxin
MDRRRRALILRWLRAGSQALCLALAVFSIFKVNYAFFIAILAVSLILGNWFCGWLCPLGAVQDWLGQLGRRLFKRRLHIPPKAERILSWVRYVLLGLSFLGLGFVIFLSDPYRNFHGLLAGHLAYVGAASWVLLGLFLAASLLVDRPFCRYFCLEGAKYGLAGAARIFSIRRDPSLCLDCGACDRACPVQARISDRGHVRHPSCMNCLECLHACPSRGALKYAFFYRKKG